MGSSLKHQFGATCVAIVAFGCWELWKARCRAVFEGANSNAASIIKNVVHSIQDMNVLFDPHLRSSHVSIIQLETLGVQIAQVKEKKGKWIKWEASSVCQLTLNTDGSSRVGVCLGGGIVRDQNGVMVCAFSNYYGNGTNMEGEALALKDGLALCRERGFSSCNFNQLPR